MSIATFWGFNIALRSQKAIVINHWDYLHYQGKFANVLVNNKLNNLKPIPIINSQNVYFHSKDDYLF